MIDQSNYEATIKDIYDKVNELDRAIYKGNGKPALMTIINDLQHKVNSLDDNVNTRFKTLDQNVDTRFQALTDTINAKFAHINTQLTTYNGNVMEVDEKISQHIKDTGEMNMNANNNKTSVIVAVIACLGSVLASAVTIFSVR